MKTRSENKGIALIAIITVLTLISILGIYFFTSIKVNASQNALFLNDLRARLLARAGLNLSMSQLKYGNDGVRDNFCDSRNEDWYYKAGGSIKLKDADANQTSFSSLTSLRENIDFGNNLEGSIRLKVLDSASQINVNDSNPNLVRILSNLSGVSSSLASDIITYRNSLPNSRFSYEEQLIKVSGMTRALYEQIKDFITIESWSDPKATISYNTSSHTTTLSTATNARSPINVNTARRDVLIAVLAPLVPSVAASVADNIITHVATTPFYSWQDFNSFIDGLGLSSSDANKIKNNANPNRIKPSGYTTEFCFHSGGYYEIEVLSRIIYPNGSTAARRTVRAFVKMFDITQHTTKSDFRDEDTNNDGDYGDGGIGEGNFDTNFESGPGRVDNTNYLKITWLDSCPVNESDDQTWQGYSGADPDNISPFTYRTIPNAVKLGFWDNFDEDVASNQSRAWWGNEFNSSFQISDSSVGFNYIYGGGDFCDFYNAGIFDGIQPTQDRLHTFDDVNLGDTAFYLDDNDNELWHPGSGSPLKSVTINDFSKYFLGGHGIGLGWNPSLELSYRSWDAEGGFYFRIFNYDGPRASIGTEGNFPGYHYNPGGPDDDAPGRDRQDVGRVEFFSSQAQLFLHPIGNVYSPGPVIWGNIYQVDGPCFYVRRGGSQSVPSGFRYQRNKVYKTICRNSRVYFYVYSSTFGEIQHPTDYSISSSYSGYINLYSNANQAVWDDVRVIDDEGRIAKHFVIPEEVDLGSFHCNAFIPQGSDVYLLGAYDGTNLRIGIGNIDISLRTQEANFAQSAGTYFPNLNLNNLGPGAQAIEGPSSSGNTLFSYSIRLKTTINSLTPRVPALEDVSLTYLPSTEIIYCYEQ